MKSCPTCNRTYPDDTLAFCLVDGAVLSAPYEPEQTQRIPPTRVTSPPATEVLRDPKADDQPKPSLQSTIHAPPPPAYSPRPIEAEPDAPKRSLAPWLILAGAILLVGVLVVAVWVMKFMQGFNSARRPEPSPTMHSRPSPSAAGARADETKSACGTTVGTAIYDKWISTGGEGGKLGCPVTREDDAGVSPLGTTGRWIQFAGGDGAYLIEHKSGRHSGKVFEVSGCMHKLYGSMGGTRSWLGFPISDGYDSDPGVRQDFEGGYTVWDRKTYQCWEKRN